MEESSALPEYQFPYAEEALKVDSFEDKIEFAKKLIRWASGLFGEQFVMSTSFGIQSAVLLHLVSQVAPDIPVVFIDTGYLFTETYRYSMELGDTFCLNIKSYQSDVSPAQMEALYGRIWDDEDPDKRRLYGLLRKVIPMKKAQKELEANCIMAGLRSHQTDHRAGLKYFEHDEADECFKLYPLLMWTKEDIEEYFTAFDLPRHPLYHQGYTTVGDTHSSRPRVMTDKSDRDTRFGSTGQQECGLHTEKLSLEDYEEYVHSMLRSFRTSYGSLSTLDPKADETSDADGFVIYGKPNCRYCRAAKLLLSEGRQKFTELHIVTVLSARRSSRTCRIPHSGQDKSGAGRPGEDWVMGGVDWGEGDTSSDDCNSSSASSVREVTADWLTRRLRLATKDILFTFSTVPQILLDGEHVGGFTELCTFLNVPQAEADRLLSQVQQELLKEATEKESQPSPVAGPIEVLG